jgi:hypothetical protein
VLFVVHVILDRGDPSDRPTVRPSDRPARRSGAPAGRWTRTATTSPPARRPPGRTGSAGPFARGTPTSPAPTAPSESGHFRFWTGSSTFPKPRVACKLLKVPAGRVCPGRYWPHLTTSPDKQRRALMSSIGLDRTGPWAPRGRRRGSRSTGAPTLLHEMAPDWRGARDALSSPLSERRVAARFPV